ncbi:MAG TPA: hypothetical protein VL201_00655 [Patescibacteria group bacterium]|nr:hypothetical protein [Patescibacteria group bacterium]
MFKKEAWLLIFTLSFYITSLNAAMEKYSAIFSNCGTEIIRDAESLQKIFVYIMNQLDQQGAGSVLINYTEAGYTLLQALQKGGYLNLTIENKENKVYFNCVIQQKPKSIKSLFSAIKSALVASSYTV